MKHCLLFSLILFYSMNLFSQEGSIQVKLDSILVEADLMYKYERSVWNSTDLLMSNKELKMNFGGYIVYHSNDTITVTYLGKGQKESIARYGYKFGDIDKTFFTKIETSRLTTQERELFEIKEKIVKQLSKSKYEVTFPQGYNPNLVLINESNEYRLYIIMGTTESGVIPLGNDYMFKADSKGNITDWKKFHSRMIPIFAEFEGQKVTESSHSHLRTTPYITATDICTFRLYAQYTELEEFSVFSPALGLTMTYILKTNKIEIKD